jgi:hypothetical protein
VQEVRGKKYFAKWKMKEDSLGGESVCRDWVIMFVADVHGWWGIRVDKHCSTPASNNQPVFPRTFRTKTTRQHRLYQSIALNRFLHDNLVATKHEHMCLTFPCTCKKWGCKLVFMRPCNKARQPRKQLWLTLVHIASEY